MISESIQKVCPVYVIRKYRKAPLGGGVSCKGAIMYVDIIICLCRYYSVILPC